MQHQYRRPPGRPLGEIAEAILRAAQQPGTVIDLAERALTSKAAARYTVSRMLARGDLVVHTQGRPAHLVAAEAAQPADDITTIMTAWAKP